MHEDQASLDPTRMDVFPWDKLPEPKSNVRWFLRRGDRTELIRGFRSKTEASAWIDRQNIEWRVGFLFRIKWDGEDAMIVDRRGIQAPI